MPDKLDPISHHLVLDLVEWVAKGPRPYAEVMDAWRTSCPRLTVWEDAVDHGFLERKLAEGTDVVQVTALGEDFLRANQRPGVVA